MTQMYAKILIWESTVIMSYVVVYSFLLVGGTQTWLVVTLIDTLVNFDVKYMKIIHIWTAVVDESEEWSSQ